MKDIDRLSRKVPNLCKVAPSSQYHVEDVHRAGGIFTILGELRRMGLIHDQVGTIHSATLGQAIDNNDLRSPGVSADAKQRALAAPGGVRTTVAFSQDKYFAKADEDEKAGCIRSAEHAYSAERLSNGNTLIACQTDVREVDWQGKTIWQKNLTGVYHAIRY